MTFLDLVSLLTQGESLNNVASDPRFEAYVAAFAARERALLDAELPAELCSAGVSLICTRYRLVGDWLRKESPGGVGETEGESLSASQVFERWGYEALEAVEQLAAFDVTAPRRG